MARRRHPSWADVRVAVLDCSVLGLACVLSYWLVTHVLSRIHSVSPADDLLGGLWAVIATMFVYRITYQQSITAAVSRVAATAASLALCLIYLIFLPFHLWGLGVLIGASALAVILIGRPGDAITAGITTAVVLGVAALSPAVYSNAKPVTRSRAPAPRIMIVELGSEPSWIPNRLAARRGAAY